MPVIDDFVTILQTAGVGTFGSTLYAGSMPPDPAACVVVLESPAARPTAEVMGPSLTRPGMTYPRLQVQVRAVTYVAARNKAIDALAALHRFDGTVSGHKYEYIRSLNVPPFFLKWDENDRPIFAFNLEVTVGYST